MSVLMIGATEREKIAEAIAYAKAHPVTFDEMRGSIVTDTKVLKLEDRQPGHTRPESQHVIFPGGYRASYSVEIQPAGICSHLSISVFGRSRTGMVPSKEVLNLIAKEFGVPFPPMKFWLEEFDPGEFAVNLVSLYAPTQEGNA